MLVATASPGARTTTTKRFYKIGNPGSPEDPPHR
jgi:hypothetical protein